MYSSSDVRLMLKCFSFVNVNCIVLIHSSIVQRFISCHLPVVIYLKLVDMPVVGYVNFWTTLSSKHSLSADLVETSPSCQKYLILVCGV